MASRWSFKPRRHEVSRVEGFSDAVLAFAVTLLVVSLDVPRTFKDLMAVMAEIPAFAICFTLLFMVWWRHHNFFRRYGLEDPFSITMTGILLFVVLIYVYPLKFVFRGLMHALFTGGDWAIVGPNGTREDAMPAERAPQLMMVYSAAVVAVFGVFTVLYHHAYRKRDELGLDPHEVTETRMTILDNLSMALFGVVSILIAAIGGVKWSSTAGFLYAGIGPVQWALGEYGGRLHRRIDAAAGAGRSTARAGTAPAPIADQQPGSIRE
jgi:uncharacterized membrane protein